jgi:hypothetical protein
MSSIYIPLHLWKVWYDHLLEPNPEVREKMWSCVFSENPKNVAHSQAFHSDLIAWLDDMLQMGGTTDELELAVHKWIRWSGHPIDSVPEHVQVLEFDSEADFQQKMADRSKPIDYMDWAYILRMSLMVGFSKESLQAVLHGWASDSVAGEEKVALEGKEDHVGLTDLYNHEVGISMHEWWKLVHHPDAEATKDRIVELCTHDIWNLSIEYAKSSALESLYRRWALQRSPVPGDASIQIALRSILQKKLKKAGLNRPFLPRHLDLMLSQRNVRNVSGIRQLDDGSVERVHDLADWSSPPGKEKKNALASTRSEWWTLVHSVIRIAEEMRSRWDTGELWGPTSRTEVSQCIERQADAVVLRITLNYPTSMIAFSMKRSEKGYAHYAGPNKELLKPYRHGIPMVFHELNDIHHQLLETEEGFRITKRLYGTEDDEALPAAEPVKNAQIPKARGGYGYGEPQPKAVSPQQKEDTYGGDIKAPAQPKAMMALEQKADMYGKLESPVQGKAGYGQVQEDHDNSPKRSMFGQISDQLNSPGSSPGVKPGAQAPAKMDKSSPERLPAKRQLIPPP